MPGGMVGDARKRAMHLHPSAGEPCAEPCWEPTCAPHQIVDIPALVVEEPAGLPGYTVEPDFAGGAHVWRDDNGRRVPVLSRYHCADARLWEFIVARIGGAK